MQVVLAVLIGSLYAIAIYLMLRRSIARLILGLALLTNATNLLIFTVGGLTRAIPPLIPEGEYIPPATSADPVPQSLILTAIVIGFGVLAFMMVLAYRTSQIESIDDLDGARSTDALVLPQKSDLVESYDEEEESHPREDEEDETVGSGMVRERA
jgi:multicomponent Na+:H+ antiporter subunit C